jgi:hypothetical protein
VRGFVLAEAGARVEIEVAEAAVEPLPLVLLGQDGQPNAFLGRKFYHWV